MRFAALQRWGEYDMFKLDIDMALYFVEPMSEHGQGIRVTRRFELPFVPYPGLLLNALSLNGGDIAMGYKIEEITWDVDREVFFGRTSTINHCVPIAFIPLDIRSWLDRGWRFGSYEDTYGKHDGRSKRAKRKRLKCEWDWSEDDEVVDQWSQKSSRSRPASFNTLLRAVVREMARLHNNLPVAYAIAKTKRFFTESQLKDNNDRLPKKFRDARAEFSLMSFDQQYDWAQSDIRRYPRLEQFLM